MNYKRIAAWVAIIGLCSGILSYARSRDMALNTLEIKQEQLSKSFESICLKLDAIYLYLIQTRDTCPNSDKPEDTDK